MSNFYGTRRTIEFTHFLSLVDLFCRWQPDRNRCEADRHEAAEDTLEVSHLRLDRQPCIVSSRYLVFVCAPRLLFRSRSRSRVHLFAWSRCRGRWTSLWRRSSTSCWTRARSSPVSAASQSSCAPNTASTCRSARRSSCSSGPLLSPVLYILF